MRRIILALPPGINAAPESGERGFTPSEAGGIML